ncbi:MAG: signal recognition particle receptor subunit alpha [Weeping tea tree witches'-broom phytoplasma]|uniref:signal recognition particle receptor subunit alpha n=1 Tax=Candidatus Phytoplasma melaleucae TaxID=2982630 RepID=UPI00293AB201|nr:signal recognition particle receptor subunit alpha [Weeping tea tree witches'-broom phytoplasma]
MSFLNQNLQKIINVIRRKKYFKENDLEEIMKEVRLSFLESDVDYEVITEFNKLIYQKILGKQILKGSAPQEQIIQIIQNTLIEILGPREESLSLTKNNLNIILLVGLQGSGKTTVAGKLSFLIHGKMKKKVLLIAADHYRPGAVQQLEEIGDKINIHVFSRPNEKILHVIHGGLQYAQMNNFDIVIIDTAGFSSITTEVFEQIKNIKEKIKPVETLIVADVLLGQQVAHTVKKIHEQMTATGVIMTKMDADIKGGSILSIKHITKLPIKFISSSEKPNDDNFELFYPERIVSRILGMGDILTLMENIEDKINSQQKEKLIDRLLQEDYNYYDFQKQLNMLKKFGSLKRMLNFIPGINSQIQNMPLVEDNIVNKLESIINSMTIEEKLDPQLIKFNNRRRTRIMKGSGTTFKEITYLIDFLEKQKKIAKNIKNLDSNLGDNSNYQDLLNKFINQK